MKAVGFPVLGSSATGSTEGTVARHLQLALLHGVQGLLAGAAARALRLVAAQVMAVGGIWLRAHVA